MSISLSTPDDTSSSAENVLETASQLFSKSIRLVEGRPKAKSAFEMIGAGLAVAGVASEIYKYVKSKRTAKDFTIKVPETDPLYDIVEAWVNDTLSDENKRNVFARSKETYRSSSGGVQTVDRDLVTSFDGTIQQDVTIHGHHVRVLIADSGSSPGGSGADPDFGGRSVMSMLKNSRTIVLSFTTRQSRDEFVGILREEVKKVRSVKPGIFTSSSWGGFRRIETKEPRPLSSVVLKRGQMERLVGHVKTFFENEDAYARIGSPYHTGIVLHGIPGTGKTSTASAIASSLGLNIYIITLSTIDDDDALSRCVAEIPPYSVMLLEDVDVYKQVRQRTDDDEGSSGKGVTMQGILNALDGIATPHGVVKILTTNHLHKLDEAIVRAGRIDLTEELGALDDFQIRALCDYLLGFVPQGLPHVSQSHGISAAEVSGICRKYVPNFGNAAEEVLDFVESKVRTLQTA